MFNIKKNIQYNNQWEHRRACIFYFYFSSIDSNWIPFNCFKLAHFG